MRKRTLGVVLLAGLAMSGAGAFTNSNNVSASVAGVGDAAVSGVVVNDIDYTIAANGVTGEDEISVVEFTSTTDMTGKSVVLRLTDGGVVLTSADNLLDTDVCVVSTTTATCSFLALTRADLVDVDGLEIVVYDND